MATTETTNTPSARQRLLDRARETFSDRTFSDLDNPVEGAADLDEAIDEILTDYTTRQAEYDEKNEKLRDLLMSDPDMAEVVQLWVETGDPRKVIVEKFGDDLGMSEEARENFSESLNGWRERKAENDALSAEAETNWQQSLEALEEWGNAKNLSLEQKRDVMLRLLGIAFNGMVNKYTAEDFDLAFNASNYETDVAAARAEGEVTGRNAKIEATRRDRSASAALPPAAAGGQGARTVERKPRNIPDNPFAGIK